jgi:Tol biopolymer transport system component
MRHQRITSLLAAAVVLIAPIMAGGGRASAADDGDTRIVWSSWNETFTSAQIMVADPDGNHLRQLTRLKPDVLDFDPVFSPDGSHVVFERDKPDRVEIVITDARGNHQRAVDLGCVDPCSGDVLPSWTANGARIVFQRVVGPFDQPNGSARSAVLYTENLDGSDVRRLSEPGIDGTYEDSHARYAPDGSYLTFLRGDNVNLASAVFRMDPDGTNVRQLTPWELGADLPDLSVATRGPTKDLVVFETFGHPPLDVATVPATCTTLEDCSSKIVYVTHNGGGTAESFNPSWSPDGRRIAYVAFTPETDTSPFSCDIWTIRPDGTGRRQVSTSPRCDFRPDWGPVPN